MWATPTPSLKAEGRLVEGGARYLRHVTDHQQAQRLLAESNEYVHQLGLRTHEVLAATGAVSYVKTIYVGYEINGEMIAALYPRADHVEVALALPEDAESRLLIDASHLTWRTLPVAAIVTTTDDLAEFSILAKAAAERVRTARHNVMRDNDFFVRSKRERRLGNDQ